MLAAAEPGSGRRDSESRRRRSASRSAPARAAARDKLTLVVPPALDAFGLWVEQLIAESTGKNGTGVVPIAGEPLGRSALRTARIACSFACRSATTATTQRRRDARVERRARRSSRSTLPSRPRSAPNSSAGRSRPRSPARCSASIRSTSRTCSRRRTRRSTLLGEYKTDEASADGGARCHDARRRRVDADHGRARARCAASRRRDPDADRARAITSRCSPTSGRIRRSRGTAARCARAVRDRTRAATMFGYGPRYLHSTGQLHKGGAEHRRLRLIITATPVEDLPIPGEPFSFGTLELAQALGDFASLDATGRRALHVHLPAPDPALLRQLSEMLLARAAICTRRGRLQTGPMLGRPEGRPLRAPTSIGGSDAAWFRRSRSDGPQHGDPPHSRRPPDRRLRPQRRRRRPRRDRGRSRRVIARSACSGAGRTARGLGDGARRRSRSRRPEGLRRGLRRRPVDAARGDRSRRAAAGASAALFTRFRSREDNPFAERLLAALRQQFGGHAVKKPSRSSSSAARRSRASQAAAGALQPARRRAAPAAHARSSASAARR